MKNKKKMREERREKWTERVARLSRPSKAPEGREERLLWLRYEGGRKWNEEKRSGKRRLFKNRQGSKTIKNTIIKRLN